MSDTPEVTLGEVYRLVQRVEREHGAKLTHISRDLAEVREQTLRTNGTVGRHEERLRGHDVEIRDIKKGGASGGIVIPTDAKTITTLLLVLAGLLAAIFKVAA